MPTELPVLQASDVPPPLDPALIIELSAEIRELAAERNAIILAHNHPSGDPSPSREDVEMTRQIATAASALNIALHDHLVIGRKGHASFRSLGLL